MLAREYARRGGRSIDSERGRRLPQRARVGLPRSKMTAGEKRFRPNRSDVGGQGRSWLPSNIVGGRSPTLPDTSGLGQDKVVGVGRRVGPAPGATALRGEDAVLRGAKGVHRVGLRPCRSSELPPATKSGPNRLAFVGRSPPKARQPCGRQGPWPGNQSANTEPSISRPAKPVGKAESGWAHRAGPLWIPPGGIESGRTRQRAKASKGACREM